MDMAETTIYKIERLNNDNYQMWKFKLELLLIKEGLWEHISEQTPLLSDKWKKDDKKSRGIIGLHVEYNQLIYIQEATTTRESWESLKKHHEKSMLINELHLFLKIGNLMLEENGNMVEDLYKVRKVTINVLGIYIGSEVIKCLILKMDPRLN